MLDTGSRVIKYVVKLLNNTYFYCFLYYTVFLT